MQLKQDMSAGQPLVQANWPLLFRHLSDGLIEIDRQGHILACNEVARVILGLDWSELSDPGLRLADYLACRDAHGEDSWPALMQACHRASRLRWGESLTVSACRQRSQKLEGECYAWGEEHVLLLLRDRRASGWTLDTVAEEERDALTGLLHGEAFAVYLQEAMQDYAEHGQVHTLCSIDMDQFRRIQNTCGVAAGDHCLRELATLLRSLIRRQDVLARSSSHEFLLLLWRCPLEGGQRIAELIVERVRAWSFSWRGVACPLTVSVGVAELDAQARDSSEALQGVERACELARRAGRDTLHCLARGSPGATAAELGGTYSLYWVRRLNAAMAEGGLLLYGQSMTPLQELSMGLHFEVLLRLRGEAGEILAPGVFLPAAEHHGLMLQLDRWVIEHTLQWLHADQRRLACIESCAINLSAASVSHPGSLTHIQSLIEQYEIPPHKLCFEVTETLAISNMQEAGQLLAGLRARGCHVALDDFGSGMSSLAYLRDLPVDLLKIDGSFVHQMSQDVADQAMVRAMNDLAHATGKLTIAEFCEDAQTLSILRGMGVDYVQGYHLGRPTALDTLWLEQAESLLCAYS